MEEGKSVARASLQAALDAMDSATRSMASVVAMQSSGLQSSDLQHEVQQSSEDLPFEGTSLFSEQTDSKLHSLKDSRAILKSLGLYTLAPLRKRDDNPQPVPRFFSPPTW